MTEKERQEIIELVHKTLRGFFEPFPEGELGARPFTQTEKVLLEVNKAICEKIKGMPTEERPQWIPCFEKLPEDDKEVLVYVRRKDGKESEMNGLHIARKNHIEGDPEGNNNFWGVPVAPCEWRIEGWSYFFEPKVLAWMELPEPYRKEGNLNEHD